MNVYIIIIFITNELWNELIKIYTFLYFQGEYESNLINVIAIVYLIFLHSLPYMLQLTIQLIQQHH